MKGSERISEANIVLNTRPDYDCAYIKLAQHSAYEIAEGLTTLVEENIPLVRLKAPAKAAW